MPRQNVPLLAFNRGVVSNLALGRVDLERLAMSAEVQTNWMPRSLGSMMLRPGLGYLGSTHNNEKAQFIPFIFSTAEQALMEFTDNALRAWVDDVVVSRVAITGSILNNDFDADLANWTDADETGALSSWKTGGYMSLVGTGNGEAIRRQTFAVTDIDVAHPINIVIERGPVIFRLGNTSGGSEYIETSLKTGVHSIEVMPSTVSLFIEFASALKREVLIDSIIFEPTGDMVLSTGFAEADLANIRYDQSADVIFLAGKEKRQYQLERRSQRSWSIVDYDTTNGPFGLINIGTTQITASGISGNVTLTASKPLFKTGHVGGLFKIDSSNQKVSSLISGDNQYTDKVRVFGVGNARQLKITVSNDDLESYSVPITGISNLQNAVFTMPGHQFKVGSSFLVSDVVGMAGINGSVAQVTVVAGNNVTTTINTLPLPAYASGGNGKSAVVIQRSIGSEDAWEDVGFHSLGATNFIYNDGDDNLDVFYRLGVNTGDYVSGSATASLDFPYGSITGIVRVTEFTDNMNVEAEVLQDLGGENAEADWYEGQWSQKAGFPTAVRLNEGRLWWAGKDRIIGSVSDAYFSYDTDIEGDSAAINRTLGFGSVDDIHWLLSLQKLMLGTANSELTVRSSSFDEVVTPTNFNLKDTSTQGSSFVDSVKVDSRGMYVNRSGTRLMELSNTEQTYGYYNSNDLTLLAPDIARAGIISIAAQRQPDTRIHCVLSDGSVIVYVTDPAENLSAWIPIETDGLIEDVVVLKGQEEDQVYYVVKRTNGRYLEKWAMESECRGSLVNGFAQSKLADSFIESSGQVINVPHLNGEQVIVWADGKDKGVFTVENNQITLDASYANVMVGLYYKADYKSSKLAYAAGLGTALSQRKRINALALILADTHATGITYGSDENNLDDLPAVEEGKEVDENFIWKDYDFDAVEFNGEWNTDSRLHLRAEAPKPCTVVAAIISLATHDKS